MSFDVTSAFLLLSSAFRTLYSDFYISHDEQNDHLQPDAPALRSRSMTGETMKNRLPTLNLLLHISLLLVFGAGLSVAQSVASVLSRLDQTAHSFTAATANIRAISHTAVIEEDDTEVGNIIMKRVSSERIHLLITFTGTSGRSIVLRDHTLEIYYPKLNLIQEYDIQKYGDVAQKLLLLGFGTSGHELASNYEIKNLGGENVGSEDTTRLELTPKAPELLKQLKKVELWISEKTGLALQQKFYMPDGDHRVVTYTNLKVNPVLSSSALDLPKGAKRMPMN
jgi:outer membrane lipoprotein-sorting protein